MYLESIFVFFRAVCDWICTIPINASTCLFPWLYLYIPEFSPGTTWKWTVNTIFSDRADSWQNVLKSIAAPSSPITVCNTWIFLSVLILFLCCLVWKAPISSQAEVGLIHSKLKNSICFHKQIFKLFYYFLCFTACLYVYMCTVCLTGTCWSQEMGHSIPWD